MPDNIPSGEQFSKVLERLDALEAGNQATRAENARLRAELGELRGHAAPRTEKQPPHRNDGENYNDHDGLPRRRLLKRMAGAGAVGAGVLAIGDTFAPRIVRAAAGGNMILGQANDAGTVETSITSTVVSHSVLRAIHGGSGILPGTAALTGDMNVNGPAVAGLNSTTGIGGAGVLGVTGSMSSVAVPAGPSFGGAPPPASVVGDTTNAPYAIAGTSSIGTAVYGCAFGSADATHGVPVAAVVGDTNSSAHPAIMGRNSNGPQLQLVPGAALPASGAAGELFEDNTDTLWLCLGNAGFRKVGGPTTAGQLHVLTSPVRVYDSRTKDGPLVGGSERAVALTTGTDGKTPAVPAGAQAALVTLTIVNTGAQGFLAAFSNAVAWPGTSNVNWFQANSVDATSVTTAVDSSAQIKVHCGGTQTDFVIDVTGYYQ